MSFDRKNIPAIITTDLTDGDDGEGNRIDQPPRSEDVAFTPSTTTAVSPDEADRPSTPAIDIQLSEPEASGSHHHYRSPSDPNFLTPILKTSHTHKPSLEVPGTPSLPSPGSDGSMVYPPSPTLSTRSSVHFQQPTSLSLRENNPDSKSGMESLQLLRSNHNRQASNASFVDSNDGTEPDSHARSPPSSYSGHRTEGGLSPTITHVENDLTHTDADKVSIAPSQKSSERKKSKDDQKSSGEPSPGSLDLSEDTTDPTPFTFKPLHLAFLVDPKSLDVLSKMGGVDDLLKGIGTDSRKGLSESSLKEDDRHQPSPQGTSPFDATVYDRRRVYGTNYIPARKSKTLLQLMWLAFKEKILILLSIAAVVSLALGLFQDFGTPPEQVTCEDGTSECTLPRVDWVEGVAIIIAIIIVDVVGSVNDWQKERQFKKLNEKKEDRQVKVIRNGQEQLINATHVLVGDIALLEPGEIIPCDGIFLRGHAVRCDESAATGESDAVKKCSYKECMEGRGDEGHDGHKSDCFLISGSKVLEGVGEYVIIAVGPKSFHGRITLALRGDAEETPLQGKLNRVAELIAKFGSAVGILLFTALMIRFFVELRTNPDRTANEKAIGFVNNLVISFTLVVVAVPEGLPLAVTLALAFATKRMTKENLLVRLLASCETMANVSVVCTDKTGTLTQNQMSVVAGSIGIHCKFVRRLQENTARTNAEDMPSSRKHGDDFSVDQIELNKVLPQSLQTIFNEAVAINSTAFEDRDQSTGQRAFVGSKTEVALLGLAKELNWPFYHEVRENADVVEVVPFSSARKASGVVVKLSNGKYRLHLKGASEILSKKCTRHVVVPNPPEYGSDGESLLTEEIDDLGRDNISRTIIFYANQTLRTIALCYRDLDTMPDEEKLSYENFANDLTLIAIVGIEDPLRPNVREAVANCHKAGVAVKMCTGDNVLTARSIASQCGIFTPGGIVMEGPVFRTLNDHDMKEILPRLQVLARSSPEDKQILVESLKRMGELVGVTGDGTNDGPALKKANVGFSMGIAGTEVAKEASDIILMDDNFASIVSAIIWGRCVNDAVRKFLQFQISVNITAVIVTFVTAVASASEQSALTAVQLLWINIIMDTFAALALATDPASSALLDRQPERKSAPLFNVDMTKQILGQATYQTIVVLTFHFLGHQIWHEGVSTDSLIALRRQQLNLQAFIFNTFVFCQIFNSINCRRLDNKLNIFEGVLRNWYFIAITTGEIVIQILIMFFGGAAFSVGRISGLQWAVSIILGLVSIPLGALIRCIPNSPVEKFGEKLRFVRKRPVLPTEDPARDKDDWQAAVDKVKDNLSTFASIRGGRLRASSIVRRSRTVKPQEVTLSSLMTMVPTFVATSVAGRWTTGGSLSDPAHDDPSRSSAALWEGKIQLHPDTAKDDPAYIRWGGDQTS